MFVLCTLLLSAHVAARASLPRRVVVLTGGANSDGIEAAFVANLRAYLATLDLTLEERELPGAVGPIEAVAEAARQVAAASTLAAVWVTGDGMRRIVYVYEPAGPHLRARSLVVSESPAAASEQLALIVHSAILARLQGGSDSSMAEIALPKRAEPRREPPRVAKAGSRPQTTAHKRRGALRVGAGLGFVYSHPLREAPWQPGLGLRGWLGGGRVRLGLAHVISPGLRASSPSADILLDRHPSELFSAYELRLGAVVSLIGELGLGVDLLRRRTEWTDAPLMASPHKWHWIWYGAGRLRTELRLVPILAISAAFGAEVPSNVLEFRADLAGERYTVSGLLRVRPTLDLGLVVTSR